MSGLVSGIYGGAVPLRFEEHRHLRFSDRQDLRFAVSLPEVPIVHTEWVSAARHYPVVFTGPKPSSPDNAVALVKMTPEDTHPFLRADNGHWLPDLYIPQYLRLYPFTIQMTNPKAPVLMAVIEAPHFSDRVGEPLFTKAGELSPFVQERFVELKTYLEKIEQTHSVIELFRNMGLLSLGRVFSSADPDHERLTQVVSVAPENLSKLPAEALGQLNQQGILPLAYAQIQSLQNFGRLLHASQATLVQTEADPAVDSDTKRPAEHAPVTATGNHRHYLGLASALGLAAAFLLGSWLGPDWQSGPTTETLASSETEAPLPDHEDMVQDPPAPSAASEQATAMPGSIASTKDEPAGVDTVPVPDEEEPPSTVAQELIATVTPPVSNAEDDGAEELKEAVQPGPEHAGNNQGQPMLPAPDEQTRTEAAVPEVPVAADQGDIPLPAPPASDTEDQGPDTLAEDVHLEPEVVVEPATSSPSAGAREETGTAAEDPGAPTPPPVTQSSDSLPDSSRIAEAQTAAADPRQETAPPLTPEVREQIADLLQRIQRDIRRNHLSLPVHDNAVDKINRINVLDPGNPSAKSALYDVVDRYIYLARRTRGRRGRAYLQSAHRIAPDLLEIDQAWDELYAPEPPVWYAQPQD